MFKVQKSEDTVNKTFRLPKTLVDNMLLISQQENISLNNFVIQCCEYAISDMEQSDSKKD